MELHSADELNPLIFGRPPEPLLVVLSGPSGVGKDSALMRMRELGFPFHFVVTATDRAQRPGEINGIDYHFVQTAEFERMIAEGELLEWADIHGGLHRSGTPREPIERRVSEGNHALVEVDLAGARALRNAVPEAFLVFLAPPSWDALVQRLTGRGTESPAVLQRRLATAKEELAAQEEFDTVVVNTDVRSAACELLTLVLGESVTELERCE
jgi:guanylate kinase